MSWGKAAASASHSPVHSVLQLAQSWPLMCLCHAPQVYVTGHGGEDFLKFQDKGEMQSSDLADAIHRVRCSFHVSCSSCRQGNVNAGILMRREAPKYQGVHACCASHRQPDM